jgi:hypothetical protein
MNGPKVLPPGTYVIAVRSLYATLTPTLIMAVAFLGVGSHVVSNSPDTLMTLLVAMGTVTALVRVGVLLCFGSRVNNASLELAWAHRAELLFAIPYLVFAATFGAFSARAFQVATAEDHMIVIGLLFGYSAGVAAGVFLRPRIALPCSSRAAFRA